MGNLSQKKINQINLSQHYVFGQHNGVANPNFKS